MPRAFWVFGVAWVVRRGYMSTTDSRFERRPLVGLALIFVLGIFLGSLHLVPLFLLLPLSALILGTAFLFRSSRAGTALLALALVWVGISYYGVRTASLLELDGVDGASEVRISGRILEEPILYSGDSGQRPEMVFPLEVSARLEAGAWKEERARVLVHLANVHTKTYSYGERWILKGRFYPFLRHHKYAGSLYADGKSTQLLERQTGFSLKATCFEMRRFFASKLNVGLQEYPRARGLLKAILLGYRELLTPESMRYFTFSGTVHIFALSGLHVGILAVLLIVFLKTVGVSRPYWILFLLPSLFCYVLATGMKASTFRAFTMAAIYWGAPLLKRKPDAPSAVALAAIAVLLVNPLQIQGFGFILSFSVVSGILLVFHALAPLLERVHWRKLGKPAPLRESFVRYVGYLVITSLAAWAFATPLTALFFNICSPLAVMANIVVIPLAFVIVFTGCLSLTIGSAVPLLLEVLNHANRVFVGLLEMVASGVAEMPGSHFFVQSPSIPEVIILYSLAVVALVGRRRVYWVFLGVALALILGCGYWRANTPDCAVDILDVGYGEAICVNPKGGKTMLIDAGPRRESRRVARYLKRQGINRLDALICTQPADNYSGATIDLMQIFSVDELWVGPSEVGLPLAYRNILKYAAQNDIPVKTLAGGESEKLREKIVLHVVRAGPLGTEAGGLVLKLEYRKTEVLFMGGAGAEVERELLSSGESHRARIMVTGPPSSEKSCSSEWLKMVNPISTIVSTGSSSYYEPLPAGVCQRIASQSRLWRTDLNGSLRLRSRRGFFQFIPLAYP